MHCRTLLETGNLAAAHNGAVSYGFSWDRLNRLEAKTDSRGRSMQFSYDKAGSLLTKTGYQGSTTHYVHNAAKRLVMLRNPDFTQVGYQYDPAGRLLSRVSASGARSNYESDANGWLSRLTHTNSLDAQIASTQYHRDRVGNIRTQIAQSAHDPGSDGRSDFEVDALYRLRTADHPGSQRDEHFSYDAVGNRRTHFCRARNWRIQIAERSTA